jgi:hypothetical protein
MKKFGKKWIKLSIENLAQFFSPRQYFIMVVVIITITVSSVLWN